MRRQCAVAICGNEVTGYSTRCEVHKKTLRRHGHAEQKGVTVYELAPYRRKVAERRAKNPGNATWELLRGRWTALLHNAEVVLSAAANGSPGVWFERQAARQLQVLRDTVEADTAIDTALAMIAFAELRPVRFKSDDAFDAQLARRVRGLSRKNAIRYVDPISGASKVTYRDVPHRVLAIVAGWLKAAFGAAGISLARLDEKEAASHRMERQQTSDALGTLQ